MNQIEKAQAFGALHVPGDPLVLYNIWDAGGAKALAEAGAVANATGSWAMGSWAMAAAHGYDDGEAAPLGFVLQIIARIAATVDLPLTVDFEGGYAVNPEAVRQNLRRVIEAGAIGVNFEDQVVKGVGVYPVAQQVARIAAVRGAADALGVPLFINARTDVFLQADRAGHEGLCAEAVTRAAAYAEAGADGFFVPGLTQSTLIQRICGAVTLPVNVMMMGQMTSIADVAALGVARVSYGPSPFQAAGTDLTDRFKAAVR